MCGVLKETSHFAAFGPEGEEDGALAGAGRVHDGSREDTRDPAGAARAETEDEEKGRELPHWRSIYFLAPANNRPLPAREARPEEGEARGDEDVERGPDADHSPAERESESRQCDEDRARGEHRPHEIARVSGTDEDPVEGEDGAAEWLHRDEERPEEAPPDGGRPGRS